MKKHATVSALFNNQYISAKPKSLTMRVLRIKSAFFIAVGFLILTACPRDKCLDTICPPNETCKEGTCECNDGYERDANGNCVAIASGFSGSYQATDSCSISGTYTGFMVHAEDVNGKVVWTNLYEAGQQTTATLSADGKTCTIDPNQQVDGFPVSGMCTLQDDGDVIIEYQLQWTSTVDSCTMYLLQ